MGLATPATVQKLQAALHAKVKREILLREPDAGKLHVRFDEREVETEQGRAREAPADERAGRIGPPKPPRHFSTLLSLERSAQIEADAGFVDSRHPLLSRAITVTETVRIFRGAGRQTP